MCIRDSLYSLGYFNICDGLTVYTRQFLNMDWMNRLNLQVPTTIDEFTDVLRAFRDNDANGDGDPTNEIPLAGGKMCIRDRSLPIVTTISLYYAVAHWNVYTAAILYIQDTKLMPLQVILRRMINSASTGDLNIDDEIPPETLRMAAVCIATAPIVIIYPFIQKYFVKGTLAGAVKG